MCVGIALFANNKTVKYGKGTNSHSFTADKQGFNEDDYRKYEYHWFDKKIADEDYDAESEKILRNIDRYVAGKLVKAFVKKHFKTAPQIYNWLKDVPDEWKYLQEVKDKRLKNYLFKKITGYTPEENKKALVKAQKKVGTFIERVKKAQWFKPKPKISKKEISLKVGVTFNLFHLPKAKLEFKYLSSNATWNATWNATRDATWNATWNAAWNATRNATWDAAWNATWDATRNAARNAASNATWNATWNAAWNATRNATWDAARNAASNATRNATWDAAWNAARNATWNATRNAEAIIVSDLKEYKEKYPKNPFMPLFELWEMGLYPCGLVNGKFLIYVPLINGKKPKII